MTNTFFGINIVQEQNATPCNPVESNIVIITKCGGVYRAQESTFRDWERAIVFPDKAKADYFLENFNIDEMDDFKEGMDKSEEHFVHIFNIRFPKPESIYADQILVR